MAVIIQLQDDIMSASGNHILLVEDDNALLLGVSDLLEMAGYRVSTAPDGQAALQLLRSMPDPPDLIVSDIRMPNMDGYELLRAVRSRPEWLSIPFIFLSAKGEKSDIHNGRLLGADDYVTKPFEFQDLLVSIQSCLKRHQQLASLQESQMEALKRRILSVLNHEFRTPLSFIVAYADLMASNPSFGHSEELRQYINGILDGSERLLRLIESFLILAELESGRGEKIFALRKLRIDNVDGLLRNVLEKTQTRAARRGVTLGLEAPDSLPAIMGDYTYLEAALTHLIDNAIKFSPTKQEAQVLVRAEVVDDLLRITVIDQGIGIPEPERKRLYQALYQIDRDQNQQPGIGAGLAIVWHVARLHNGSIQLESEPGKGSRFCLSLPIAP